MLRLALRTVPLFAVIVGFAMALGAYMNYSGVRSAYLDLIRDRMLMVADDVGLVIEAAVSVGIAPAEQVTLPALLARQIDADPLIRSIDVVSPDRDVLFSGRAAGAGADDPVFTIDRPVLNDFGVEVARLQVRYDAAAPDAAVDAFGRAVLVDAIPAGIIAVLLGSLSALLVLSLLHRRANRAARSSDADAIAAATGEIDAAAGEARS